MNRNFASWIAANPCVAVIVTGLLGLLPLFGLGFAFFLPGAVPALVVLVRGPRDGVLVAAGASLLLALAMWMLGRPIPVGLIYSLWVLGPPLALGVLLRRSGSLALCLQVAVLAGIVMLALLHLGLGPPEKFSEQFVRDLSAEMQGQGVALEDDEGLFEVLSRSLWGWVTGLTMLMALFSAFFARWLETLSRSPGRLAYDPFVVLLVGLLAIFGFGLVSGGGVQAELVKNLLSLGLFIFVFASPREPTEYSREFNSLKLGLFLGGLGLVVALASVFSTAPLVIDTRNLFLLAFALVGLAAAHGMKDRGVLTGLWLPLFYLALVLAAPLMAAWGFVENWLRSRRATQSA